LPIRVKASVPQNAEYVSGINAREKFREDKPEKAGCDEARLLNSCHQPGLPFASFNVPASVITSLSDAEDVVKWPQQARLL
ncbi:hypothetical protein HZD82_26890, partial [Pantoea agglomerans]|nr:hypothetical protein [Pantoea agglomerans]